MNQRKTLENNALFSSLPLFRIQAEPKLLPQEEVTYAEPVLVPQPPPKLHSPKNTLRKGPHQNNAETLFQFQTDAGYNGRDNYRGRDNFGTLRSHQVGMFDYSLLS